MAGGLAGGVGFGVHMVIAVAIGLGYTIVVGTISASRHPSTGWLSGDAYGFVWWILGPLLMMPILLGMGFAVFAGRQRGSEL